VRFGIVGLGRMGGNLSRAAIERGHDVLGHSLDPEGVAELAAEGLEPAPSLDALVRMLAPPRLVLVFVPHGRPTEEVCAVLRAMLTPGDVVVDGGNSH
jgi:6-phosphogluconate dehydrogenase